MPASSKASRERCAAPAATIPSQFFFFFFYIQVPIIEQYFPIILKQIILSQIYIFW